MNFRKCYFQDNLITKICKSVTSSFISLNRRLLKYVKVEHQIYALGGFDKDKKTSTTCEVYDIRKNNWTVLANMK